MTHRGPFQPLPFCDSVISVLMQWEVCLAAAWDIQIAVEKGFGCAGLVMLSSPGRGQPGWWQAKASLCRCLRSTL